MINFLVTSGSLNSQKYHQLGKKFGGKFLPELYSYNYLIHFWHEESAQDYEVGLLDPVQEVVGDKIETRAVKIIIKEGLPVFLKKREIVESIFGQLQEVIPDQDLEILDTISLQTYQPNLHQNREIYGQARDSIDKSQALATDFQEVLKHNPEDVEHILELATKSPGYCPFFLVTRYLLVLEEQNLLTGQRVEAGLKKYLESWDKLKTQKNFKYISIPFFTTVNQYNHLISPILQLEEVLPRLFESQNYQSLTHWQSSVSNLLFALFNHESFDKHYELIGKYAEKLEKIDKFISKPEVVTGYTLHTTGNPYQAVEKYLTLSKELKKLRQSHLQDFFTPKPEIIHLFYHSTIAPLIKNLSLGWKLKLWWQSTQMGISTWSINSLIQTFGVGSTIVVPVAILLYSYFIGMPQNPDIIIINQALDVDIFAGIIVFVICIAAILSWPLWWGIIKVVRKQRTSTEPFIKFLWSILFGVIVIILFNIYGFASIFVFGLTWDDKVKALDDQAIHFDVVSIRYDDVKKASFDAMECKDNCQYIIKIFLETEEEGKKETIEITDRLDANTGNTCEVYQTLQKKLEENETEIEVTPNYTIANSAGCKE